MIIHQITRPAIKEFIQLLKDSRNAVLITNLTDEARDELVHRIGSAIQGLTRNLNQDGSEE